MSRVANRLSFYVAVFAAAILSSVAAFATDPTDLPSLVSTETTAAQTGILAVLPSAFTLIILMIGAGLLYRWLRKATRSS